MKRCTICGRYFLAFASQYHQASTTRGSSEVAMQAVEGEVLPPDNFFWGSTVTPEPTWCKPDKNVTR